MGFRTPRDYELTFTGSGTQTVRAEGRYLRVLEAPSAAVYVTMAGGSELKRNAGQGIDAGGPVNVFSVRSTVAQTVRVTLSDTPQDDNQQTVTASVTATVGPGNTITSTADHSVAGVSTEQVLAGNANRLTAIIKNLNGNSSAIRVGDSAVGASRGHELMPGESIALDTDNAIYVYNSDAGAQSVSLLEIEDV